MAAVVEQCSKGGGPVGSKFVAEHIMLDVSPATVRNEMATLEIAGLLEQPHTSSGRIPTNAGYRSYIDHTLTPKPLQEDLRCEIDAMFNVSNADPDKLLEDTALALANLTGFATICTTTIPESVKVRHIEIRPVGKRTVIILLVADRESGVGGK